LQFGQLLYISYMESYKKYLSLFPELEQGINNLINWQTKNK